jgi:hypothetical protein
LRRTDDLAVRLGVNVQDLPDKIGISRASLFSYRTGNRPLTSKAWAKLEAAERAAGLGIAEAATGPAGGEAEEREESGEEALRECAGQRFDRLEKLLVEMGGQLLERIEALEVEIKNLKTKGRGTYE